MARKRGKKTQLDLPVASYESASLAEETQRRYLNYALSVITSRALPDVRDGLKPVHRRILYTMQHELRLRPDAKYRKSAAIVGDVMGKFHPHGDTAIYDSLVRMAQSFSMRVPLVDGRGNFGSPDGDGAAAMRYTEAKLMPLAGEMMAELGSGTVDYRPNYDGTRFEPIVLPSRFPNLLVNGSYGIAVGMATSIPPHNLTEVTKAAIHLIDKPQATVKGLLRYVKGPDLPTKGELLTTPTDMEEIYKTGHGSFTLRGTWEVDDKKGGTGHLIITSVPFAVERRVIVEKVADIALSRKLPGLLRIWDESTHDCRIMCELKKGTDPQMVMAYIYKHTPLSTHLSVNLNCLVPTDNPQVAAPKRLGLVEVLRYFLDFRMEVLTRRLRHELAQLEKQIHVLQGFEIIFDALDETIRIIRRSEGKADAAKKLMKRFKLDEVQVDAILELKLYRLAKLEILVIQKELGEKRKRAKAIGRLLKSEVERWKLVRSELAEIVDKYPTPRLTKVVGDLDEPEFDEEDFIVDEDAMVVLTQQGWIKRQQRVRDVSSTRVRSGDSVYEVEAGSTRSSLALFSNFGVCYVCRIVDVPPSTGHGVPVQTLFKLKDGERIVAMMGFDPRFFEVPEATEGAEPEPPLALGVTRGGYAARFSLRSHREPSTRAGRKYMRPSKGDEVLFVTPVDDEDRVACATEKRRALICEATSINVLAGAGKGVMLIKLQKGDSVIGATLLTDDSDVLVLENQNGTEYTVTTRKYGVVSRAGKGFELFKRGSLTRVVWGEPTLPGFPAPGEDD